MSLQIVVRRKICSLICSFFCDYQSSKVLFWLSRNLLCTTITSYLNVFIYYYIQQFFDTIVPRTTSFEICIKNKTAHSFVDLFNPLMQSLNHLRVLTCYFQITKEMTEEYNSANIVFLCLRSHVQNKRMETPL